MSGKVRWLVCVAALVTASAGACARFGAEDTESSGDAAVPDAPGTPSDAPVDVLNVPEGSPPDATVPGRLVCAEKAWHLCEDFEATLARWTEVPAGSTATKLALSSARASTGKQSLEISAPAPAPDAEKFIEAIPTGTEVGGGIHCALDLAVKQPSPGFTRVLWIRFATTPDSAFSSADASLWVRGNQVMAESSWVLRAGGQANNETGVLELPANGWSRLELSVDIAQRMVAVEVTGGARETAPIQDFRPILATAVRIGATTAAPVAATELYVDGLACLRLP